MRAYAHTRLTTLEHHLRVRRRLDADHRVARRLKRDGLAATPARILLNSKNTTDSQNRNPHHLQVRLRVRRMGVALTPGRASGPKWPWPGVSS